MSEAIIESMMRFKFQIPPRPEVVIVLQEEIRKENPDFRRIVRHVGSDVGLAGALLKAVNSPAFGLPRKVGAISQAISILGLRNASGLATALALRGALSGKSAVSMDRFWDTAEKSATLGAHLARSLKGISPDEAYTVCLFHDCGMPILMQQHPTYKETLARANHCGDRDFSRIEEEEIGTHHGAVGYFLARSWMLPDPLCQAILWHHDVGVFTEPNISDQVRNHIGVIHLAEHLQHLSTRNTADLEWLKFERAVLDHFGLTEEDFLNLVDDSDEALAGTA